MVLSFSKHSVHTRDGTRVVHVGAPTTHVRVGRERLAELKEGGAGSIDREVLAHAQKNAGQDQVFVFRGRNDDGTGSWDFEDGLTADEQNELGLWLVRSQVPTYRRLVGAGVFALVHCDWPVDAVRAYEHGTSRLLTELELKSIAEIGSDPDEVAFSQADRWILRQLTFFYSLPFDKVLSEVLQQQLPLLEQSIPHLQALVQSLPRDSVV